MNREKIQEQFKTVIECGRNARTTSVRKDAEKQARQMLKTYPWLADFAALYGIEAPGTHTESFPWLRQSIAPVASVKPKANATAPAKPHPTPGQPWRKPETPAGYEWRRCYKELCHCMRGGPWHGPYRYTKKWRDGRVYSEYIAKERAEPNNKSNK